MATTASCHQRFLASRSDMRSYPLNLHQTAEFDHALKSYHGALSKNESKIFDKNKRNLRFLDLADEEDAVFKPTDIDTISDLIAHIGEPQNDPRSRFVFLQSRSNRGRLCCSKDQLTYILAHHEVMPSFLDHVLTFRQRPKPHLATAFHSENFLDKSDRDFALPGRSGLRTQHCFNLLSVERNERYEKAPEDEDPWQIRQAGAYHSFDPIEGRSLWILVKGNDKLKERISTATQKQRAFRVSSVRSSREKAFVSNLVAHRVMFEWCAENWNDYIEHLEEEVKPAWKSRLMPVTEMVDPEKIARRLSRKKTIHEPIATLDPQSPMSGSFSEKVTRSLSRLNSGFEFKKMLSFRRTGSDQTTGPLGEEPEDEEEEDHVGNYFSFTDLQKLTRIGDNLEQTQMVMEQNMNVLKEIREYYEVLVKSSEFSKCIDVENCYLDISSFFRKMVSIERSLEMAKCRVQSLARMLESNKELYYGVLQYENNEVGKVYAHYAKMSTDRMEDIARKTEQETVSMHVITIFTLLFLPGTFIATFFSSGVFEWDEDGKLGKDWKMRGGGMKLFMVISIPMMVTILSVWFIVYWLVRRSRQNKQEARRVTVERESEGKSIV